MTYIEQIDYQKMYRDSLTSLLTSQDPISAIKSNLDIMLSIIPELAPMIGFEHMHPHHHLDVWEHTLLAVSLAPADEFDTRLALLLHDIGKPHSWTFDGEVRHFSHHAIVSESISRPILERLGFPQDYIDEQCLIIKNHDDPITDRDIDENPELSKKLFKVQICDCLAHNPEKNEKRLQYIEQITDIFNSKAEQPTEH